MMFSFVSVSRVISSVFFVSEMIYNVSIERDVKPYCYYCSR